MLGLDQYLEELKALEKAILIIFEKGKEKNICAYGNHQ